MNRVFNIHSLCLSAGWEVTGGTSDEMKLRCSVFVKQSGHTVVFEAM